VNGQTIRNASFWTIVCGGPDTRTVNQTMPSYSIHPSLRTLSGLKLAPVLAPRLAIQREMKQRLGVGADTLDTLEKEAALQVVDEQLSRISKLTITSGERQIELVQTNNQWQVVRPARWDAEPASIRAILEALSSSVILEFVDNPTNFQTEQIANAPWIISFSAEAKKHRLRIARPLADGRLMMQRDDEASFYITDGELPNIPFNEPLFYRNRTVLQIDPQQIQAITLQTGEKQFRVENVNGQYTTADRTQKPVANAVFKLVGELTGLRTEQYIAFNPDSLTTYGLDSPSTRLNITLAGTNMLGQVLLLGDSAKGGRYAMLQGQPVIFVLPETSVDTLTQELTQPVEKQTEEIKQP